MKKAQSLSMNTIVIAALALLVLVIVALITTGRISIFSRESADCKNQGGDCKPGITCPEGWKLFGAGKCTVASGEPAQICCIPIS